LIDLDNKTYGIAGQGKRIMRIELDPPRAPLSLRINGGAGMKILRRPQIMDK
jgi:hypothetical protein